MLARCWASVWDAAPASSQRWSAFIPFVPSTVQSKRKYSSCMRVALTKLQVEQINIVPTIYKNDYMRGGLYTGYMHTSITKLVTWLPVLFFFQYQCLYGRFLINTTKHNNSVTDCEMPGVSAGHYSFCAWRPVNLIATQQTRDVDPMLAQRVVFAGYLVNEWVSEYCFTSLSAQSWQYRDRRPFSYRMTSRDLHRDTRRRRNVVLVFVNVSFLLGCTELWPVHLLTIFSKVIPREA